MHTHVHTCIYIYECTVDTYISLYEYAHYITPNVHKKETLFATLRHLQEKGYQATSETETSSEASYLG